MSLRWSQYQPRLQTSGTGWGGRVKLQGEVWCVANSSLGPEEAPTHWARAASRGWEAARP